MKWEAPWFLRMIACQTASRGPAIRMASGSSERRAVPVGKHGITAR